MPLFTFFIMTWIVCTAWTYIPMLALNEMPETGRVDHCFGLFFLCLAAAICPTAFIMLSLGALK